VEWKHDLRILLIPGDTRYLLAACRGTTEDRIQDKMSLRPANW